MDSIVSTLAPIAVVAAAVGATLIYTTKCSKKATKSSKKTTTTSTQTEESDDIDNWLPKKKVKEPKVVTPKAPKAPKAPKEAVAQVEGSKKEEKKAAKEEKKAAKEEKKVAKEEKKAAKEEKIVPVPKKELSELELLRQRIAELENTKKAPEEGKKGKKAAAAAAAAETVVTPAATAPKAKKGGEYNPEPQMSAEQRKEQEKALQEFEKDKSQWREYPKNTEKKTKNKTDPYQYIDLSVLTETETMTVTFGNRRIISGDNGETLKSITAQTGCNIQLQQRPDKSVLQSSADNGASFAMKIELEGTTPQIKAARNMITDLISKGYSSALSPGMIEVKLKVDPAEIGQIVGPAAVNLKKIIEVTQVKISLPPKDSQPSEAIIHIVGDAACVDKAKEAIKSLVRDGYSALTHPDWTKITVPFPALYRRYMFIPNNGSVIIRAIEKAHQCNLTFPQNQNDEIGIVGPASNVYSAAADVGAVAKKIAQPVNDVFLVGFDVSDFKANEIW